MNKNEKILTISVIIGIMMIISIPSVMAQTDTIEIPSWIKIIAGAWYNDDVTDTEYADAMSFLIENNIIEIKSPLYMAMPEESEMVVNLNRQIDDLDTDKTDLENQVELLEKDNESLRDKAVTDDVLADLETMRQYFADADHERNMLKNENAVLQAELDALKQN